MITRIYQSFKKVASIEYGGCTQEVYDSGNKRTPVHTLRELAIPTKRCGFGRQVRDG